MFKWTLITQTHLAESAHYLATYEYIDYLRKRFTIRLDFSFSYAITTTAVAFTCCPPFLATVTALQKCCDGILRRKRSTYFR